MGSPVLTTSVNFFVLEPAEFVAFIENLKVPAFVGLPLRTPFDDSDIPAGRLDNGATLQVGAGVPEA